MFKKPFKIKSNTRLKGSDTKKLKLLILKHFPSLSDESLSTLIPNKEVIFSVKIIVHSGEIVVLYCVQKLPVTFEVDDVMYPTVYMLWHFPDLLPIFTTYPPVFSAISGGADLMLPGVVLPGEVNIKSYGKLDKGERVSINLTSNKAPIAVGKAALSSFDMYMSAKRGKCVNILHFYGDTLSNYGSTLPIPELGPVEFNEQSCEQFKNKVDNIQGMVSNLTLNEETDDQQKSIDIDEQSIEETERPPVIIGEEIKTTELEDTAEENSTNETGESLEESMDELLMYCFLKSVKTTVKKSTLPLLASTFYKQHILAACPPGKYVDIKKTKYKKLSNFLSEVAETKIISLEMVSKGVQSISSVTFENELLKNFDEKYFMLEQLANNSNNDKQAILSNKPVAPEVKEKHTVTAAVLPLFSIYLNKKGDSLTLESIRRCITDYVRVENLKDDNKKYVKTDKLLKNIIGGDKESVTWEVLINGVVSKMGHSYELSAGEMRVPTVVKGKLQPIDIQVGTRVGNKKVTLVSNLELYGINVTEFAQECQHGVGASTTINNVPGAKSAQVQIQGNQVIFVNKLLTEKYTIQKRFIRGLENAPKRKK